MSPKIYRLLSRLRSKIRSYVLLEGIAWLVAFAVMAFWVFLAIDFLPVKFGLDEMSRTARVVALVVTGLLLLGIFYRTILRRLLARLRNDSMALLIERRYPEFTESLVTTVTAIEHPLPPLVGDPTDAANLKSDAADHMQQHTQSVAEGLLNTVDVRTIMNSRSLNWKLSVAASLLGSVVVLWIANPDFARFAAQRLYGLDAKLWPRMVNLELMGIKVARQNPVEGIPEVGETQQPQNNEFKIARGASLTILARAQSDQQQNQNRETLSAAPHRLPENCRMVYKMSDNSSGSLNMNRIGAPRNGFQMYSIDGQPLTGLLNDLQFEIRGGDDRIGPFRLKVVDQPAVISTQLACVFPAYMVDEKSMRWTPRDIPWTGQSELPMGTTVTVKSTANKPLQKVYAFDSLTQQMEIFPIDGVSFQVPIAALKEPIKKEFYLCDDDGLISEQPFTIAIKPVADLAPMVQTQLSGIGTAVTPKVKIPFNGRIKDDYGIARAWLEIAISDADPLEVPIVPDQAGAVDSAIDFLEKKRTHGELYKLPTEPDSTVSLIVKAEDRFNLADGSNIGLGDKYVLDIVDENQMVRILERSEVAQRRRLEQIYLEIKDAQGYLKRTLAEREQESLLVEPGEEPDSSDADMTDGDPIQPMEIRLLFSQRTLMQIEKSIQEMLGVADAFENIRLQLINNRIDSEDRQARINDQVVAPLRVIAEQSMADLKTSVRELESQLQELQSLDATTTAELESNAKLNSNNAIEQTQLVIKQIDEVLNALIKYETQNELLEIVRQMIKQQQDILERTKKERQSKDFEDLLK